MEFDKKRILEVGVICVLLLLAAWYVEKNDTLLTDGNHIARASPGEGTSTVELTLSVDDVIDGMDYTVSVQPMEVTEDEAEEYIARAEGEIDAGFYADGEDANRVTQAVSMKKSYAGGMVTAKWSLDDYSVMDSDGNPIDGAIDEGGTVVEATATLTCGDYSEAYLFSFCVYPRDVSEEETLLAAIDAEIDERQEAEGEEYLTLPDEVDGHSLVWGESKQHLVLKVLLFEIVIIVLLKFMGKEKAKENLKKRREQMSLDYAEVVNKLQVLLGSGMTLKQAWNSITAQYLDKREKKEMEKRWVYEEMLVTCHEMADGESERVAYQKFGERTGVGTYHRLVRILVQNLQTGSRGLCQMLSEEAENALEERRSLARKLGEEAGTKLLFPMIIMLGIVMIIIMVPAMMQMQF